MLVEPQPTAGDLKWRMLGIPVRVAPWFWLVGALMGWERGRLDHTAIWIACVFVAILVHEFGHALTARAFGAEDLRVVLYAMGGLAIHPGGKLSRWQRVVELLMGPGAGFILYGLIWAGTLFVARPEYAAASDYELVWHAVFALEWICLWWGLVNLLPVYPLDGGQISRELCEARWGRDGIRHALRLSMIASIVAAAGWVFYYYWKQIDDLRGFFPVLLFGYLAFLSYQLLRVQAAGGGWGGEWAPEEPRQPWEQDPDWWKGSS